MSKFNIKDIQHFIVLSGFSTTIISTEYKASKEPLIFRCSCGEVFERCFDSFKRSTGLCKKCAKQSAGLNQLLKHSDVFLFLKKKGIDLLSEYEDIRKKLHIRLPCGHEDYRNLDSIKSSFKVGKQLQCRKCGTRDSSKLSLDEVVKIVENYPCKLLEYSTKGVIGYSTFQCSCGAVFTRSLDNLKKTKGLCNKCTRAGVGVLTFDYVKDYVTTYGEGCTLLSSIYLDSKSKLTFICSCGNTFERTFPDFKANNKCCNKCSKDRVLGILRQEGLNKVLSFIQTLNPTSEYVGGEYVDNDSYLTFKCSCCGQLFERNWAVIQQNAKNLLCHSCSKKLIKPLQSYYEEVEDYLKSNSLDAELIKIVPQPFGCRQRLKFKCKCGRVFYRTFYHLKNHTDKCKACSMPTVSKGEGAVASFIGTLGLYIDTSNRDILYPKEIDIYIPSLKIGIEFNGDYWHSIKGLKYHPMKYNMAKEKGIELLFLWEHTYNTEDWQELIKRALRGDVDYRLTLDYTQNYIKENQ
jgi:hypothetical protein